MSIEFAWHDHRADAPYESEQWASSDRGWLHWTNHPHLDPERAYFQSTCVGNYLQYSQSHGDNGETFHACAYIFYQDGVTGMIRHSTTVSKWFFDAPSAKSWIEETAIDIARRHKLAGVSEYQPSLPMV